MLHRAISQPPQPPQSDPRHQLPPVMALAAAAAPPPVGKRAREVREQEPGAPRWDDEVAGPSAGLPLAEEQPGNVAVMVMVPRLDRAHGTWSGWRGGVPQPGGRHLRFGDEGGEVVGEEECGEAWPNKHIRFGDD